MYAPPDRRAGAVLAEPTRAARTLARPPRPEVPAWGGGCRTSLAGPETFRDRATHGDPRTMGCRRARAPASGRRRPRGSPGGPISVAMSRALFGEPQVHEHAASRRDVVRRDEQVKV